MSYAYRDSAPHDITWFWREYSTESAVVVEDDGVPFNPHDVPAEVPEASLENSRLTGAG